MQKYHGNIVGGGSCRGRHGFTLLEVLMVVVILGILAALALPKFSDATHVTRENVLKDELRYLRTQLIVYKAQHRDIPAGYPGGNLSAAPTEAAFLTQMTNVTDGLGNVGASSVIFHFGPYLSKMPPNPLNGRDTITIVADGGTFPPAGMPDNTTGWILKPQTQEILPNSPGTAADGTAYTDF